MAHWIFLRFATIIILSHKVERRSTARVAWLGYRPDLPRLVYVSARLQIISWKVLARPFTPCPVRTSADWGPSRKRTAFLGTPPR